MIFRANTLVYHIFLDCFGSEFGLIVFYFKMRLLYFCRRKSQFRHFQFLKFFPRFVGKVSLLYFDRHFNL